MAHKKLNKITNPQLWYQEQKNGLVEAVVVDNFGAGPNWFRLWVPANKDDVKLQKAIVKRMASDHSIELAHYTRLISQRNPVNDFLLVKETKK